MKILLLTVLVAILSCGDTTKEITAIGLAENDKGIVPVTTPDSVAYFLESVYWWPDSCYGKRFR